jgi:hypothetical protein
MIGVLFCELDGLEIPEIWAVRAGSEKVVIEI